MTNNVSHIKIHRMQMQVAKALWMETTQAETDSAWPNVPQHLRDGYFNLADTVLNAVCNAGIEKELIPMLVSVKRLRTNKSRG